ncbi:hypothetical protein GH5_02969 [Leishmania sp. Ghana 2012 LV757]|uniref:hypothetical protein n=1 Tax=Leishmania sp. Ghana 2012 LV757 TaxID=2803181 RepID=UPI001B784827|nr:hypothetical protein GH5_02969 [Leishmania sp. Ghana 2012 LV757]
MSTFSCQCQSCRGNLVATEKEFYFTCSLFRIDLGWPNLKRIRLETQQVKGVPTSVLVVTLQHNEAVRLQSSGSSGQKKRFFSSRKYFFYDFHDLLGAEEQIRHFMEQYRASERAKKDDARDDSEKGSSATIKLQADKAEEKDEVSSPTSAPKDESLNYIRSTANRQSDSEPQRGALGLSFASRRAPPSNSSRPKLAGKLVSIPQPSASKVRRNKYLRFYLQLYRCLAALLIVVMVALLTRQYIRFGGLRPQTPFHTAERLLRDIAALSDVSARLEAYDSHESMWQYNRRRKDMVEERRAYTHQLEQAAVELMERYVALQARMTTLRGHRAQRVAREQQSGTPSPPPPTISSVFGTPNKMNDGVRLYSPRGEAYKARAENRGVAKNAAGQRGGGGPNPRKTTRRRTSRRKKMPLSRLTSDVLRWIRQAESARRYVISFISVPPLGSSMLPTGLADERYSTAGGVEYFAYTEEMSERFRLTEWVSAAEYEDRHSCQQLTNELLETVELTERLFATFSNAFLMDHYRKLESGEERASHWMQPPQALRTVTGGSKYYTVKAFSGEEVARVAMLRRFVGSLVHNEPLEANQASRRSTALQLSDAMVSYREREVQHLRARNQGSPDNFTGLWRVLEEEVLQPSINALRDIPDIDNSTVYLRNSVAELSFWHTHEAAWREHILSFFTPEEQAEIRSSLVTYGRSHNSLMGPRAQPAEYHWVNLPLFRGLLCFGGLSHLQESATDADTADDAADISRAEEKTYVAAAASEVGENNTEEFHSGTTCRLLAAPPSTLATFASLPAPPTCSKASSTKKTAPSIRAAAETPRPSQTPATPPHAETSPDAQTSRSTDLWKEVKLRWMADLDVFRLAFDARLADRSPRAARSYCMKDEEHGAVADAAEARCRLFGLLSMIDEVYVRYLNPLTLQRLGAFLRALFPPYFKSRRGREVYISALQSWGTQDPAVQLATAQVISFAPGTTSDVSRSLLYLILQPPPLLQTSVVSTRQTTAAAVVLVLFVGVLLALYIMH